MALAVVGGGRRSGKSRYALALASSQGSRLGFIATLTPTDQESLDKVANAQAERGPGFITFEEPLDILHLIREHGALFDAIVIDDLTVWVANLIMAGNRDPEHETRQLLDLVHSTPAELIFVTSDVDFGFPVDSEASRAMRRDAGLINRLVAEASSRLYWMVFGIPKRIR
ncbi:MAG TPA: bifunctional adenosylcobinamide kinase/adenosylcobinamide-phosphate guanylyltransferase [Bryobacteraceae bacterium]|nr:bifunctional adenosylcobinamide kinase/adenosylcobinamide-phosphate guanylyltransferase [Bryobacteraceae bacterium]